MEKKNSSHKPSIDILFNSLVEELNKDIYAFILNGIDNDTINGIINIKNNLGTTYA